MKFSIIFILFIFILPSAWADNSKDCTCPVVSCGPCQEKQTIGKIVKFCNWGDINVCRKVICENVNSYFACLSNLDKSKREEGAGVKELQLVYELDQPSLKSKESKRLPASEKRTVKRPDNVILQTAGRIEANNESRVIPGEEYSDHMVGVLAKPASGIKIFHRGQVFKANDKRQLYVGDEIVNTGSKQKIFQLAFDSGEVKIRLMPKSKMIVHDPHSIVGRFQPFLYLVHGGVEVESQMKEGFFDLLAGQVLSRSRQGKQRVTYVMDEEGLKVKMENLRGHLDVIRANDLSGKTIGVDEGQFVSWVSETPAHLFTQDEKMALAGEGFVTPVFQMTESQKRELGMISDEKKDSAESLQTLRVAERTLASDPFDSSLCQSPSGQFQQCAWSCQGNPKGANGCQADHEGVHCVRRTCNAAGQWSPATAFASSYKDLCPATGVRVGDCSP